MQERLAAKSAPVSSKSSAGKTAAKAADMEDLEAKFKRELRASATRELASFDATEALADGDKRYWLMTTVPEVPVAGAECMVYLNRQQSEPLLSRPRVEMHFGFNR